MKKQKMKELLALLDEKTNRGGVVCVGWDKKTKKLMIYDSLFEKAIKPFHPITDGLTGNLKVFDAGVPLEVMEELKETKRKFLAKCKLTIL